MVLATFPVVLPFALMQDVGAAKNASRLVALAMLFLGGLALGRYAGYGSWRAGLAMMALGVVMVGVILALGTFAAQTLLGTKESIGKLRGTVHRYHGIPLVVTYHPAALLRNPAWKRPTWEDVQLARRILDRSAGT